MPPTLRTLPTPVPSEARTVTGPGSQSAVSARPGLGHAKPPELAGTNTSNFR